MDSILKLLVERELVRARKVIPCSPAEVAEVLASQDVLPPAEYIEFLETCGRGLDVWGRGLMLFYPEILEIRRAIEEIRFSPEVLHAREILYPSPEAGFVFALESINSQEDAYFSTWSYVVHHFAPRDPSVYKGSSSHLVAASFPEWLASLARSPNQ